MAPCGESVVPRVPQVGFWRIGIPGSVAAPLPLIDAVNFLGECAPRTIRVGYMCRNPARPRRLTFPEEVCAGPRGARIP